MDAGRHPTRAVRPRPHACAVLAAILVVLSLLLAAPTTPEASVPAIPVALLAAPGPSSHHAASGGLACHAVAACAVGLIPALAALPAAGAGRMVLGRPDVALAHPSRALAPDPPPPRP